MAKWLPVPVWMWLIFSASSDQMSYEHSSRLVGPIVQWLFPHLSVSSVDEVVFLVRKCAHLTEYAILALLLWRALRPAGKAELDSWRWSTAGFALLLVLLYAASDEFHQTFVPSRDGSVVDVLIDTAGGASGLLLLWTGRGALKMWRARPRKALSVTTETVKSR